MSSLIRYWLYSLLVGGTLTVSLANNALAQITPDNTLPTNSNVIRDGNTFNITGGTEAGRNLFHSFQEFSVPNLGTAYFNNARKIENIISRVAGGTVSNIDGLIRTNGAANLFLINPNGIIFGRNASLNIGGSFVATTASSLKFVDGREFSATNTKTTPLLTMSVPAGLQFGENPGSISNSSNISENRGLNVKNDKTLALIGGDVNFQEGRLITNGGRIELGSVAEFSLVNITPTLKGWAFNYEGVQNFQDIRLSNKSIVNASGVGGGDIQVRGRNIKIEGGSQIRSNTRREKSGGTLNITVSELVDITGISEDKKARSGVFANVNEGANGSGSNVVINTNKLRVNDGAVVSVSNFGNGNAGNLTIKAELVEVAGESKDRGDIRSGLLANVDEGANGRGGNVVIDTNHLSVIDGAEVSVSNSGNGNASNLTVNATDVKLSGTGTKGRPSGLFAVVRGKATGNGGHLTINANEVNINGGAGVFTYTVGSGNAGNLTVNATDIELDGTGRNNGKASGLFADVGRINFMTGDAMLYNPTTRGKGGDLTINTNTLKVSNGAQISASTFGEGNAGNLMVKAADVILNGTVPKQSRDRASGLFAYVDKRASGSVGTLTIDTKNLIILSGAQVLTSTFGQADAGNINIKATDIEISGTGKDFSDNYFPAGIFFGAATGASGNGGNLSINTYGLTIKDGARVGASNVGEGNASGSFNINATDIILSGMSPDGGFHSGFISRLEDGATGKAGNLTINTNRLSINNGARVEVTLFGEGNTGNVTINASQIALSGVGRHKTGDLFPAGVFSDIASTGNRSESVSGGITINTRALSVNGGATVSANTRGKGNAGNLTVIADDVLIDGTAPDGQTSSSLLAGVGKKARGTGGDITLKTRNLRVLNKAKISVGSIGSGSGGGLNIEANSIFLDNGGELVATTASRSGGNINLQVRDLIKMRANSKITAEATNNATGGNIKINVPNGFIVAAPRENSDIIANADKGRGGNININATGIYGLKVNDRNRQDIDFSQISDINASSTAGPQLDGTVEINQPEINPNADLINLPTVPVDTEVAQGCSSPKYLQSSFTITGRGGLPINPKDILTPENTQLDWVALKPQENRNILPVNTKPNTTKPKHIVEATRVAQNAKGELVLTANSQSVGTNSPRQNPMQCQIKTK